MKAIILAAGCGTRLRPYTNQTPKCMVKLADKPLLHYQIDTLVNAGFDDIVVVGGYFCEKIRGDNIKIAINKDYESTNMVKTLFCAEEFINDGEDLLITYGDIIYEPRVLKSLINTNSPIAISIDIDWEKLWQIRMEDPLSDAETLKLKDKIYVEELGKKPRSRREIQGQYMGLIKVRADTVKAFKETWHSLDKKSFYDGEDIDNIYMTSFIQKFIDDGFKVEAAFTKGGWLEVDSRDDLDLYNELYRNNDLSKIIRL